MTSTEPHPDTFPSRADDPMGEALLLQAVRDGSTAAFGILYVRYRSFAVGIATQALPQADHALAEDVAEVSFIRVLTALRNGKGPTDTLRSYLATTVRREAWRAQRRRRRQAEVVGQWAVGEERATAPDPAPDSDPGTDLDSHALLSEAFGGLSDRWRHVLWLTAVEGRKPAEVAPMLGVSAGSASALAYRARLGLISAYVAAYRRSTDDEACVAISDRLGRYVAAGAEANGFGDVVAHLEGCPACRDMSRGVDVLGSVLASMAPFGLLTAGWWAKSAGMGGAGLAGTAAAGTVAATHGLAGSAGTTASGVGIGGVVAAAAAVAVLAGAAWFGVVRSGADGSNGERASAAAPTVAAPPAGRQGREVTRSTTSRPSATSSPPTTASPAIISSPPVTDSLPVTTLPADPGPAPSTVSSPSRPVPPSTPTTPTASSTPSSSSTTTVLPPIDHLGSVSGLATKGFGDDEVDLNPVPVAGIDVVAYDDEGELAETATTDGDGRWSLRSLPEGRYLVVAVVPAAYRPASGPDPWAGGATWGTILGSVDVSDQALELVDLRLRDR